MNGGMAMLKEIEAAVELDPDVAISSGVLHVSVEDVRWIDGPAKVLKEFERNFKKNRNEPYRFRMEIELNDLSGVYSIRCFLDTDGNGEVNKGDFITKQSCPVSRSSSPQDVTLLLKRL